MRIQYGSDPDPEAVRRLRRLAFEAARRADAMGLAAISDVGSLDLGGVRRLFARARSAGVAKTPFPGLDNVETPTPAEVEDMLRLLIDALERSPVPSREWPSLAKVFEPEQLASILQISTSSLRRYLSGARLTPDDVAARLHFVALLVADLAGAYNDIGIRRWFDRPRTVLDGKPPSALLTGDWHPEDAGPQKVRALAQSLVSLSAT